MTKHDDLPAALPASTLMTGFVRCPRPATLVTRKLRAAWEQLPLPGSGGADRLVEMTQH